MSAYRQPADMSAAQMRERIAELEVEMTALRKPSVPLVKRFERFSERALHMALLCAGWLVGAGLLGALIFAAACAARAAWGAW